MYRTVDEHGKPAAATGFLLLPEGKPRDKGGWPLISWAHGTTGLGPLCAPSRSASLGGVTPQFVQWLRDGFAIAAADYPGLGPDGKSHAWLNLRAEGESVAHIALAAHNADSKAVSKNWFAVGLSQGGQAALGAGIWADEAKGMRLLGAAAQAPASHVDQEVRELLEARKRGVSLRGTRWLLGYIAVGAHAYDPEKFPYRALLSPKVAEEMAKSSVRNLCLDEIDQYLDLFAPEKTSGTLNPRWETAAPGLKEYLASFTPVGDIPAPVLIQQGADDVVVPAAHTRELIGELCAKKNVVDRKMYPGTDHTGVVVAGHDDLGTWLKDRLRNVSPHNRCTPTGTRPAQGK